MINYNKNKLINQTLDNYYETFSHTLDTADYVPDKFNKKISKYIFKNMKKSFKQIDKEDKIYQNKLQKRIKLKKLEKQRELKKQQRIQKEIKVKNHGRIFNFNFLKVFATKQQKKDNKRKNRKLQK